MQNFTAFPLLAAYLRVSFPAIHSSEFIETVDLGEDNMSLLYKVSGTEEEDELEEDRMGGAIPVGGAHGRRPSQSRARRVEQKPVWGNLFLFRVAVVADAAVLI